MSGGRTYYEALTLSSRATGASYTSDDFHQHDQYAGCVLVVEKTAGDASVDALLQMEHHATGSWIDVANTDIVQIAAGSATATRYCMIYPGATAAQATGVIALDTNYNLVNGFLPDTFRVKVTLAAGASATCAATVYPLR